MILPVILSGGAGSRLWPLSTKARPKQLLGLLGETSLIAQTAARFSADGFLDPVIICNAAHAQAVDTEVPGEGTILLEPVGRNTAPAAAIAALHGQATGAELVLLAPADHHVQRPASFRKAALDAAPAARAGYIVTFGIAPDRPETGYGYIRMGERVSGEVRRVEAFVEKPDLKTARTYLEQGGYAWNAGLFLFSPSVMLSEMRAHAPQMLAAAHKAYSNSRQAGRTLVLDREAFAASPADSLDYAVMEKTAHAACLSVDMGWSDIGSFAALHAASPRDDDDNRLDAQTIAVQSRHNLVISDGPRVSLVGVEGIGVIINDGEVLIVDLEQSQSVKSVVEHLKDTDQSDRL